jgi:hypothetical protein
LRRGRIVSRLPPGREDDVVTDRAGLPKAPDRAPDVEDDFGDGPRPDVWVAHYLPHWTTPQRSAARYDVARSGLRLRIDEDQLDWRLEDAPLRVSNLQTGTFSGPPGSRSGTHRHRDDLLVRTWTRTRLLWAPTAGRIDVTVTATRASGCMLAAWLIGTEQDSPDHSGEICVFEIDASAIGPTTTARSGLKAHHDPRLRTDMAEVELPFDASERHTWTVIWGPGETTIGCQNRVVRRIEQAPAYRLFVMLDLFEIGPANGPYPKTAMLHHFRGWEA